MDSEPNKLKFKDVDGKGEIVLLYRDPTVDDWVSYWAQNTAGYVEGEERQIRLEKMYRAKFEAGKRVLTGFSASGEGILPGISMEDPDWKEKLVQKVPQCIGLLGQEVFMEAQLSTEKNS
jgi:hypothetical protein